MTEAQQQLETDNLCAKRNDMELFHFPSAGPHVINHAQDILRKNMNSIRNLILNMKFIPFPPRPQRKFNSYHMQINSEDYPPKDGYENNRQLNVIACAILIYEDLVHLWKIIGYYGICEDTNDLVIQGALLILFLPTPSTEWKKPNVKDINKSLIELINLGFQLNYNVIADVFHLFEHRLDDIGNTLVESFLHVKQESLDTFLYHCIVETLKPERTYKMDVWDFIFSLIPNHAETEFNKAFNNYLSNVASIIIFSDIHIKPLASSPKFYIWVLRKFDPDAQITVFCFNDLLETRISLDIQRQASNVEVPIGMNQCTFKAISDTFNIYCNTKNFFLPSHLEAISRSASHEILEPLFENYLPILFGIEVTFPLPMETIEESDVMQIVEGSNDMQVIEGDSNGDQGVIQNQFQTDFQILSTKRRPAAKEIKEIKELWKQKLEDMHYNSTYNGSGLTNPFRNFLRIFVEEKLPYAEEKSSMVQELENIIHEQNLILYNYVDFAAFDIIDEGSVGIVYKSMWKNKLMVALKCIKIDSKPEEKEFQQFVRELRILPKVCQHQNIVKLYGVTKGI
ncbi:hypothetical protein C2G38_352933 [Gigaspora rosea]|uniref:Protein kinase domain-containing protein n=1 Tax=Gigaspora rosea TaxID=44941 RepID=A0A397UDM6_9GLOM|nr:hypothetical protein C2G38_352933 [Gigaspora rosea]